MYLSTEKRKNTRTHKFGPLLLNFYVTSLLKTLANDPGRGLPYETDADARRLA